MKITIEINCNNSAFYDPNMDINEQQNDSSSACRQEIDRILTEQASKVRFYPFDGLSEPFNIKDNNGQTVGTFTISQQ